MNETYRTAASIIMVESGKLKGWVGRVRVGVGKVGVEVGSEEGTKSTHIRKHVCLCNLLFFLVQLCHKGICIATNGTPVAEPIQKSWVSPPIHPLHPMQKRYLQYMHNIIWSTPTKCNIISLPTKVFMCTCIIHPLVLRHTVYTGLSTPPTVLQQDDSRTSVNIFEQLLPQNCTCILLAIHPTGHIIIDRLN